MGTTARDILEGYAGGMREGVKFRGVLPGSASTDLKRKNIWTCGWIFTSRKRLEAAWAQGP
jgi:NADH:ubiquinone oxidoreductase subunit F (NADH-binding)